MKFADGVVEGMQLDYIGSAITIVQRFWSQCNKKTEKGIELRQFG